jgi:hypothetical protein
MAPMRELAALRPIGAIGGATVFRCDPCKVIRSIDWPYHS